MTSSMITDLAKTNEFGITFLAYTRFKQNEITSTQTLREVLQEAIEHLETIDPNSQDVIFLGEVLSKFRCLDIKISEYKNLYRALYLLAAKFEYLRSSMVPNMTDFERGAVVRHLLIQ